MLTSERFDSGFQVKLEDEKVKRGQTQNERGKGVKRKMLTSERLDSDFQVNLSDDVNILRLTPYYGTDVNILRLTPYYGTR